jgi:hypothetical protein
MELPPQPCDACRTATALGSAPTVAKAPPKGQVKRGFSINADMHVSCSIKFGLNP